MTLPAVPERPADVIVIGAGIVGSSTALELARRGLSVALIDRGEPGHECSYGNAGWMTPCFAMPLPQPGMFLKSIKWLLDPESPLYIHPTPRWITVQWLTHFLRNMNQTQLLRAVEGLVQVSQESLKVYEELHQAHPGATGFEKRGLLMVTETAAGLAGAVNEMELTAKHGVPGRKVSADEARALVPALRGPMVGGVYYPEEAHAEPLAMVKTIVKAATALGVQVFSGTEVFDVETNATGDQITGIMTTRGRMRADRYVMCAGSWSRHLARRMGISGVPILGGKGYAMIVPKLNPHPEIPLMILERKIAVTPRADGLRIAGTLELVNQDFGISPRRVRAIERGARLHLPLDDGPKGQDVALNAQELWRGLRPCTPDGVPLIGRSKEKKNLFLNTGHQMLGLQSAPGTARLLAELLLGQKPFVGPELFDPRRF